MSELAGQPRHSARVLLVDAAGRVLLLRTLNDPTDCRAGHGWHAPGGPVRDGETPAAAAARELREETGLDLRPGRLGRPVAVASGRAGTVPRRDEFFLCRVDTHRVDTAGMEAAERAAHARHRWWDATALASSTEPVHPPGLPHLLADLLAGHAPDPPTELPWR